MAILALLVVIGTTIVAVRLFRNGAREAQAGTTPAAKAPTAADRRRRPGTRDSATVGAFAAGVVPAWASRAPLRKRRTATIVVPITTSKATGRFPKNFRFRGVFALGRALNVWSFFVWSFFVCHSHSNPSGALSFWATLNRVRDSVKKLDL